MLQDKVWLTTTETTRQNGSCHFPPSPGYSKYVQSSLQVVREEATSKIPFWICKPQQLSSHSITMQYYSRWLHYCNWLSALLVQEMYQMWCWSKWAQQRGKNAKTSIMCLEYAKAYAVSIWTASHTQNQIMNSKILGIYVSWIT